MSKVSPKSDTASASVYVAYNTGNDNTGRVYLSSDHPINSSSVGVFKTP